MNVLKNFEAVFIITLGLACGSNYLAQRGSEAPTEMSATARAASLATPDMPVVVVAAKRMSTAEKRQSLIDEQSAQMASRSTDPTI
ncbi:hypothetical protein [Rugamonas sp.]|uniref:hypothetical protein n=1 Tax=Rugamonas sp. TaxID=1926287 RepID=UPI0025F3846A|nr:hypothetical protein [Rugamonas sp.]